MDDHAVTPPYEVRLFVPGDRSSLEELYREVYGQAWGDKTNLQWTLDRPLAEGGAAVAVEGDVVVSAQPYCDLPLHTSWGLARATLFLDIATHPAHQRRGLFKRVVAAARVAAFERGASIIMTTPNRVAFQGFMTMPEWIQLCALDCLFLPLGAGDRGLGGGFMSLGARGAFATAALLLRRAAPQRRQVVQSKYPVDSTWSPDADADKLWRCAAPNTGIMVARDQAFLQWRFGSDYRLFLGRGSQGPLGYVAARLITRAGIKVGLVVDYLMIDEGISALPLLEAVIAWLRAQGAAAAMGYFRRGSTAWQQARAGGFLRLPRPLVPRHYPVCVSVRPDTPCRANLLDASRWSMSLADSDLA
jgi:GNAT superfamily N-acetyltransferase